MQQADPSWSNAQTIHNATLESHKYDPGLAPPIGELSGRDYITCFDPATGLHLGTLLADNNVEIEAKIEKAEAAQLGWRNKSFADRKRVVRSLKKWIVENQELCARVACRDTGKTRRCYILLALGYSLHMGRSHRRRIGRSYNDVFKNGLVTAPR